VRSALALVIAGEYAIYVLARTVLEDPAVLAPTTPEVRRLFEWHALEEMEHQSVACDVYHHLYGEGARHRFIHMRAHSSGPVWCSSMPSAGSRRF
jgi:predicted metal-dependent hydrolase